MLDKGKIRTFVLGGVAGALAGILLAPRSGKELRGSLAWRAGEARERGRESLFDAQERARERVSEARDRSPRTPRTEEPAAPENTVVPGLAPQPLEPLPDPGGPAAGPSPPPLRDVSRDVSEGDPLRGRGDDPEELRRRIQETRSRLRDRLDGPQGSSDKEDG